VLTIIAFPNCITNLLSKHDTSSSLHAGAVDHAHRMLLPAGAAAAPVPVAPILAGGFEGRRRSASCSRICSDSCTSGNSFASCPSV
jgi:hypothetical protein